MADINVGDIVWGRMDGFPYWPCVVLKDVKVPKPSKDPNTKYYWVYLFGSKNYSWISRKRLCPYEGNRFKYGHNDGHVNFAEAVKEAELHVKRKKLNSNYQVVIKEKFDIQEYERKLRRSESRMRYRTKLMIRTRSVRTDEDHKSRIANTRNIATSTFVFGVIGIGNLGTDITRNLIHSGHVVNIWNRTYSKGQSLVTEFGPKFKKKLTQFYTPRGLLQKSDVILVCLSDKEAVRTIFENSFGIHKPADECLKNKGIIQMTTTGPEFSKDMNSIIEKKGGKYLEAQIQRSKEEATNGDFITLAAGDEVLFFKCHTLFKAIGNTVLYLGEVGYASKMNLILQVIKSINVAALCEALNFAERSDVELKNVYDILESTNLCSLYLLRKCGLILQENFLNSDQSLTNLQKDMSLVLDLADSVKYPMSITSPANQIFQHCIRLEYGAYDASIIFLQHHH
uniref:Cytokine-like nuclear factor N-PAC n=1 Tax=Diabrotica virgifera virgifera TaxID=50390 RepID=A0A6P7G0X9_DIAVI